MKKGRIPIFFEADEHLNAAGRMLYVEAIQRDKIQSLPPKVYQHVNYCPECSAEILFLNELMEDESIDKSEIHPFFNNPNSDYFVSGDLAEIDDLLEKIKTEAIQIPLYENRIEEQLSTQYRGSATQIQLLSPQNEHLYQSEVNFTFVSPTTSIVTLIIRNHKGQVYKTKIPTNTLFHTVEFSPAIQFPTGIYYWQMMDGNRNRIVGKFYIYQG